MRITKAREAEIISTLKAKPDAHIVFPRSEYRADGSILIVRDGLRIFLHRYLYQEIIGPIIDEFLLKSCTAWGCQNPHHRRPSNSTRPPSVGGREFVPADDPGAAVGTPKTHCPRNHEYTPDNVYLWVDAKGHRHRKCRRCTIARTHRQHQRERLERERNRNQGATS